MADTVVLSEAEMAALRVAARSTLISQIPDRNEKDVFGQAVAGMGVFRKLEKRGLLFITEEEPTTTDDGEMFEFTPTVELTEEGRHLFDEVNRQGYALR